MTPDVAMDWNGTESTARLIVDGWILQGSPPDVQAVFNALNELRDRATHVEALLERVRRALDEARRSARP